MRVVCINDRWDYISRACENEYRPKIGDELTVASAFTDYMASYYIFKETPSDVAYIANYFVPIDETPTEDAEFELVENDTANQR